MTNWDKKYLKISPEVEEALHEGKPIVALESTVITHGLPYPENRNLATRMELVIREAGSIPATIAILDGMIQVGLDGEQLERLAHAANMYKISVRDIAPALTFRRNGGTTVAGTLAVAQAAGIKVFATGGIGGVHRQAPFDISADLAELAKTQLIVVCAGAKAILDIPATLEILETSGIPVIGYQTDDFPAFYSISSGRAVGTRVNSPEEVVQLANTHWELGLGGSVLVVAPPPKEVALEPKMIESVIQTALEEALRNNIHGQSVTPFLLLRVSELTGGKSMQANLGLLLNNARVAGQIAHYLYK